MLADHVAAAHDGKADIAFAPGADIAVAAPDAVGGKREVAAAGGSLAENQGRAGGRVALVAVMQLDDLDIEVRPERAGDACW